jgi:hypothetical protein
MTVLPTVECGEKTSIPVSSTIGKCGQIYTINKTVALKLTTVFFELITSERSTASYNIQYNFWESVRCIGIGYNCMCE